MSEESKLYDAIAVNQKTGRVRVLATNKPLKFAECVVLIAVVRRGLCEEFFVEVPAGRFTEGDKYE